MTRYPRTPPMTDLSLLRIAQRTAHQIEKATQHPPFADVCSLLVERFIYDALETAIAERAISRETLSVMPTPHRENTPSVRDTALGLTRLDLPNIDL